MFPNKALEDVNYCMVKTREPHVLIRLGQDDNLPSRPTASSLVELVLVVRDSEPDWSSLFKRLHRPSTSRLFRVRVDHGFRCALVADCTGFFFIC
jgi:hypothetical protein